MVRITFSIFDKDNKEFLNFETKEDAEEWIKNVSNTGFNFVKNHKDFTIKEKLSENYILGELWRADFDYKGMLEFGSKASIGLGIVNLQKLYESFEDVNYHEVSEPLSDAIDLLKDNKVIEAEERLKAFNKLCLN